MAEPMNLAGRTAPVKEPAPPAQYLAFVLGGETFAMAISSIKEVITYGNLTVVPMMPASIRGVINLRGSVVPVVDLSVRFGKPPAEISRRTCIVIMELPREEGASVLGVIVDAVKAVLEIGADEIEPPPAFGSSLRPDFISGVGKVDGGFVILLDVHHVLSLDELANLTSTAES